MARMRVYELARELGVDTKTVLAVLADLDRSVKSASSTIDREGAAAVRSRLVGERGPGGEKPGRDSDDQSPDIDAGALAREIAELSRRLPGELGQKYAAQIVPELLTPGSIPPQELAATAELLRGMVEDSDGSSGPVHEPPSTQREGDVAADSPLASAPHEERSPSSPEEQFDLRRWVEAAVPDFARAMLDLVVLDREDRREANASLFRALEVQCPPLTDPRYFRACLIAGAWCRDATPHPDESTRWRSLWFAGLWATAYETATGANSTANRWNQFSGLTERAPHGIVPSLVGEFAPVLSACLPSAREKALSALASALESGTSEAERDLLLRVEQSLNAVPQISSPSHPATHRAQSWSSPRLRAALEVIFSSTLSDNEAAESLIEVWGFLDPEKEEINRGRLAVGGAHELALLAGGAARSGDWRLHNLPPHKLDPIDQYVDLARLAIYSHHHGVVGDGEVAQLVLDFAGYRPLVEGSIDEGQYIEIVNRVVQAFPERDREVLKLAVEVATSVLARQADASQGARWLAALGRSQYTRLVPADSLRTLLARLEAVGTPESVGLLALKESVSVSDLEGGSAYMTAEDEHELKTLYKRGAVQQIVELIQPFQVGLVTALSHKLANPDSFTTYRTPAMSGFAYTGRDERSFHTLRSKAREGNTDEARAAREAFDAALTKRNRSSTETAVLREWRDYAAMRAESVLVVIPSWQHDFDQGSASNEVAWNLAVYYALQNQYAPALGYLDRGISSFKAPYDHLIFGVYLALQLLLQSRSSGSDRELAEDFLQVNARLLVDPEAQLLWVLLAGRQPGQDFLGEAATRITNYMALKDEPVSVPDPGTWRSPDPRAARGLLNDLKSQMTKYGDNGSWRLWLNGYLPNNRHWYPAWEYVASACEEAGDFDTAWRVMQEATDEFLRGYKRAAKRGADPARKAAGTLRQALQRLCSLTKRTNRTSNFQIYYDKYVAHVPELSLDLPANRTLVIYLGEHSERDSEVARPSGPVTGRESGAAWTSLAFPLFEVQTFGDFDQKLVERLDAALSMAPIPVQEQGVRARLEGLLQQVGVCRDSGVSQDEVSGVVQGLTGELAFVDTTIREGQFDHLIPLAGALRRALERFAQQAGAVPLLEVRAPSNWSGFSTDADESQIVLEVRNPGPGAMADIHLRAAWEGQEPMDALAGLSSLEEETPDCVVVDLPQSGVSGAQVVFEAEFDWGPVRQARTGGEVDVPLSNFASHLRQHGVTTHEFPDPFVADGPLAGDQLGTSLFQGREKELDLALSYYGGSRRPATPLCFFGIRRTGKTTLLRRIARELTERGVPTVEFSLMGLRADQMDLNALTLAFVSYLVEEARRQHPASGFTFSVPTEHPAPILVVEDCFRSLQHSLGSNLVLLIDEFQLLFYPAGEVLLDRLRACHESDALRFIAFANQGHDLMINTGSQLVLDSHRVDFLSEDETQRLLSEPLVEMGIAVHEGALREIYRLTGGHPNFTGKLAKMAVENLNQARRTMIVAEDLRRGARQIIDVPGLFGVSWFSKLNLSEDEMALAVNFAKAAKGKPGLTVSEIKDLAFDWRLLNDLEEKLVLTTQESRVAIRGTLLQMHLESKLGLAPVPTDGRNSRPAVGLFIDLENSDVGRSLSVDAATFAERLLTFSATFGAVVTAHAAAKPWHLADFFDVKLTLEAARIAVAEVPVELKRKNQGIEKNLIDMMINDLVTEAINDFNVSVVVLVTGDVDHYTMIVKSLERGVAVRLVSLDGQSRAKVYDRLAADRLALAVAQGRQVPDFLVWDLEDVLSGRAVSATHSGTSAN